MIQTSFACGLGLLVFALSDFVPTARFAWMMMSLLMLALVGDLVILPAILIGPLGRLFELPAEYLLSELPTESGSTRSSPSFGALTHRWASSIIEGRELLF